MVIIFENMIPWFSTPVVTVIGGHWRGRFLIRFVLYFYFGKTQILSIYSNTQIFSSFSTSISNYLYNLQLLCTINHFKKTIKMFVCRLCILCNPARPIGNICLWWHFCKITYHCFLLILRHFHVKYLVSGTSSSICKRYTRMSIG